MKLRVKFEDWEQSLKESILTNYNNSQIIEYKDSNVSELLEKALQILRKNQQRLGKKKSFFIKRNFRKSSI
ncbi:hypothetical protein [Aliarcobacter butzleri]|uniref:hypothetical protein n=1 Tax=Aliarcobacter butzleri TaxID=28197 RepID=UPI002B254819|nr:hypothetical protein [Aliarcobacter butzleri]